MQDKIICPNCGAVHDADIAIPRMRGPDTEGFECSECKSVSNITHFRLGEDWRSIRLEGLDHGFPDLRVFTINAREACSLIIASEIFNCEEGGRLPGRYTQSDFQSLVFAYADIMANAIEERHKRFKQSEAARKKLLITDRSGNRFKKLQALYAEFETKLAEIKAKSKGENSKAISNEPMYCWLCNKETKREELREFKRRKICSNCFEERLI